MNNSPVNTSKLRDLATDMGSRAAAYTFVARFLDLLPGRLEKISETLHQDDDDAAVDSLLSLKVSSSMAGGQQVEIRCSEMERAILAGDPDHARSQIHVLKREASALVHELETLLASSVRR